MTKKRPQAPTSDADRANKLKADFDAAHEAGKKALKERDFERVARIVKRERELIEQQRARIEKQQKATRRRRTPA